MLIRQFECEGTRELLTSGSLGQNRVINCGSVLFADTDGIVQKFLCLGQPLVSIAEQISLVFRFNAYGDFRELGLCFLGDIVVRRRFVHFRDKPLKSILDFVKIRHRGAQPTVSPFDLHCAMIWKCNHAANFIEFQIRDSFKAFKSSLGRLRVFRKSLVCLHAFVLQDSESPVNSDRCRPRFPHRALKLRNCAHGRQSGPHQFIGLLLSTLIFRNPQCNAGGTKRTKRNQSINWYADCCPKIFRIDIRVKYRDGDTSDCQIANCDQQCDECKVSDFPRAFHDFPDVYFGAIVARLVEGA